MAEQFRIEKDTMGEMRIPNGKLYGASTQRAIDNFPISGIRFNRDFIRVLALIKVACAQVNQKLGKLDKKLALPLLQAMQDIAGGKYDEHFVLDIYQTGSGTSTNMNFNEVAANIANLALGSTAGSKKPIHPNDHVNMGQSSNDVIPTAIHVACTVAVHEKLLPALDQLRLSLQKKAENFARIVKIGRTHLQDATPLTLGQEFSGYESQVRKTSERIERALSSLYELAIGGTAVGTGLNTDSRFGERVAEQLAVATGFPFRETANHFEAQASKDGCVEFSGALRAAAVSLSKIAADIRLLSSGPRCGISEITIPAVQPGSSIMPGKINPVIPEMVLQVCAQVIGNDLAVSLGGMGGNFELNTMMPLIAHNLLQSIMLLSNGARIFEEKCVRGIEPNRQRIDETIERSLMLATALVPAIGYEKAAELAKRAHLENKTIRALAMQESGLTEEQLKSLLDPSRMVAPNRKDKR
ncbi:MAG: class II fumarate hydratase [Deltaproteobacteria bacterium]|nr:class II fumarate hydratase [Deltaproteobacteria bacterium]